MSASREAVLHYNELEAQARDAAQARQTIDTLRAQLHDLLAELQDIRTAYGRENEAWDALIKRAKATLHSTLPGADLDAMSKPQRRNELVGAIEGMFGVRAR